MNKIRLAGCVTTEPTYSHKYFGEKFYAFYLQVLRKSSNSDILKCVISEKLKGSISQYDAIEVVGEIRTKNYINTDNTKSCDIFVFVKETCEYSGEDVNEVNLEGFVCKKPVHRQTPSGKEICDIMIASNRERSCKSDYIPCIAWNKKAVSVSEMEVATKVKIIGRFQSREYVKRLSDEAEETRVTYELSICKIKESETDEN